MEKHRACRKSFVVGQAPRQSSGQATLSLILLIGGIIIEIALAGSLISYLLSTSGRGELLASRALGAAEAGIRDVQIKIARNKDFVQSGTLTYPLSVGGDSTTINVSRTSPTPTSYLYTATSTGSAITRTKRLVAQLVVDTTTGLVQLQSVSEATVQ